MDKKLLLQGVKAAHLFREMKSILEVKIQTSVAVDECCSLESFLQFLMVQLYIYVLYTEVKLVTIFIEGYRVIESTM